MKRTGGGPQWPQVYLAVLALLAFLTIAAAAGHGSFDGGTSRSIAPNGTGGDSPPAAAAKPDPTAQPPEASTDGPAPAAPVPAPIAVAPPGDPEPAPAADLPWGGRKVFGDRRILVAYYGTATTPALGVLGEAPPERIFKRLQRAAKPFGQTGRPVAPVFELIVTIAHAYPTESGAYSGDIPRRRVERYIRAAHEHGVLLLLDLQPGRADFLTVAKRWEWALRDPWVGLALDPEWRMGPHGIPGRRIGSVRAAEINRVSAWLDDLTASNGLPQKILMLHQFRRDMIVHPERIQARDNLALVQHVDGFGTRGQKMDTYRHVARPQQFRMGFKLFYDEDINRFRPVDVLRIRPRVDFVSFQ